MSTYVIGDVQGCHDALRRLLDEIQFDTARDQLWFCGDLVNRGGQSQATLRLIWELREQVISVLGNHDLKLLAQWHYRDSKRIRNKEFLRLFEDPDAEAMMEWLVRRPMLHRDRDSHSLLVHAGLLPQWSVKQAVQASDEISAALAGKDRGKYFRRMWGKNPNYWSPTQPRWKRIRVQTSVFTRMRFLDSRGHLDFISNGPPGSQRKKKFRPWFEYPTERKKKWRVLFGHWAALGLYQSKRVVALDTGCVWGGKLTALRLEDDRIFQVDGQG